MRNVSKQLQKVQSVQIERSEVLNEALAKEVERNVRRREESEVQQESWQYHRS